MRGEKNLTLYPHKEEEGSPPRARGKDSYASGHRRCGGITPACAGKRLYNVASAEFIRDHPRVRGEKLIVLPLGVRQEGSPPRARGKDSTDGKIRCSRGITPACAGKSFIVHKKRRFPWDHPRVRGEKLIALLIVR